MTELNQRINELQTEVHAKRTGLKQLDDQKEALFKERNALGKQISEFIRQIKPLREERDTLTNEVKALKDERAKLTKHIQEKIGVFKEPPPFKPTATGESPHRLRKEIERLEYKIETEAPSFDKEKQLMKAINELRKKLKNAEHANTAWKASKEISSDIDTAKKSADTTHDQIQQKAKLSQEKHEQMVKLSKHIDELKEQEKKLNAQIDLKKKEIEELLKPFDEQRKELNELRKKAGLEVEEEGKRKEHTKKKKLSDLRKEVEDKIKNKQKLTNQDLLILQSSDE